MKNQQAILVEGKILGGIIKKTLLQRKQKRVDDIVFIINDLPYDTSETFRDIYGNISIVEDKSIQNLMPEGTILNLELINSLLGELTEIKDLMESMKAMNALTEE